MTNERAALLRKAAIIGGVAVLLGVAGVLLASLLGGNSKPVPQEKPPVITLRLPPPPPPPTPPKPPPPQPQKTVEQPKVTDLAPPTQAKPLPKAPSKAPSKAAPSAVPAPPGNPLTAEAGPGANPYGLQAGSGGGDVVGGGGGGGGGGGSQFGFYASMVQSQVRAALGRDEKTRTAHYRARVRVWLDAAGLITRVVVVSASGDGAIDGAVLQRVLSGVGVGQGPPSNMPLPIVLSIAES